MIEQSLIHDIKLPCYIASDLHLGSTHAKWQAFLAWLQQLPADASLILNGDIINEPEVVLSQEEQQVIQSLVNQSHKRTIYWILGNNDPIVTFADTGKIIFTRELQLDSRLFIIHGDAQDNISKWIDFFKTIIHAYFRLLTRFGYPQKHMAERAKSWPFFYTFLNRHIMKNACRLAKAKGVQAIALGHTHQPMDEMLGKIRYLNSGTWTELPCHYLKIDENSINLHSFQSEGTLVGTLP